MGIINYSGDRPILCWDPGHGGYDPGIVGYGLQEKDITLAIVLAGKILAEANGITVVLTRDGDYAPGHLENQLNAELQMRCTIANTANADLFCSTHVNGGGGEGEEVLIQEIGGRAESVANLILPVLANAGNWGNRGVVVQNDEVTRNTNMPAILTENGFMDSETDTNKLKLPGFIQTLAEAHVRGFCEIFGLPFDINIGEDEIVMNEVVIYFSPADFSLALAISNKHGGIGMFCRNSQSIVHPDALKATTKYNVGGPELNCPGEIYMSGSDAPGTIASVATNYSNGKW